MSRQPSPEQGVEVRGQRYAFDETGIDRVEFLVSPNVGEPLKPLTRIASGGETSRLMLALKSILSDADRTPTLIFDEIDVGIGGRVGGQHPGRDLGLCRTREVIAVPARTEALHLFEAIVEQLLQRLAGEVYPVAQVDLLDDRERRERRDQPYGGAPS